MAEALNVLMRFLHIGSVVTLIGGVIFGRFALEPGVRSVAPETRDGMWGSAAERFRPFVYLAIAFLVISGLYNLFSNPGHTARYHIVLGIKLLLVLHVFAVTVLAVQPENSRRGRLMAGAAISGLIIVAISAYLRRIF